MVFLLFAASAAFVAGPVAEPPATVAVSQETLEERLVKAHNGERTKAGTKALVWSARLARDAKVWAQTLAETDTFEHAPPGKDDHGENLWTGTRGRFTPEDMVGAWIEERLLYKRAKFPDISTSGKWQDVGHYTQLIWYKTSEVGCAVASNADSDYLVCRYNPPGNWEGEYAEGHSAEN